MRFRRASTNFSFSASSVLATRPALAAASSASRAIRRRLSSSMSSGRSAALAMRLVYLFRAEPEQSHVVAVMS